MTDSFPDATINGWEELESSLTLPDPDDRHLVAAAIRGRADAIVTANLSDFPADVLEPPRSEPMVQDDIRGPLAR